MNSSQPTNLTQKAVVGTAWSTSATFAKQVLSLASMATVARILGPQVYGLMGMAGLVITFIVNFRDLGTASAIIQRPYVSRKMLATLFWINLAIGALICSAVIGTAPLISAFFHAPQVANILRVFSIALFLASTGVVQSALLNREMAFRALAIADVASALAGYLVALAGAFAGLGVWSLVFAQFATSLTANAIYWAACSSWRPTWEFDIGEIKSVTHFSLNLAGFGLVNYAARNADNITIGRALGSVPLGNYQMAYNLMLAPIQNISAVISQVTYPAFSRIQDHNERFRSAYVRSCALIALFTFPIMAGMGVVADPFIRGFLGAKWIGAIRIFEILAPVGLLQSVQTTVGQIYTAKGRTDWMFGWGFFSSAVLVSAFVIGVRFGAVGVATSYCAVYLGVLAYPCFAIPFRLIDLRVRDFVAALWQQALLTGCMALLCWLWLWALDVAGFANVWVRLISTSIFGAAVYASGLFLIRPPVMTYLEEVMRNSESKVVTKSLSIMQRLGVTI